MSEQVHATTQSPSVVEGQPVRRGTRRSLRAGAVGLVLLATACGGSTENTSSAPGQTTGESDAPTVVWDGTNPTEVPFPGRVALPDETCQTEGVRWGLDNPQPAIARDGLLLAVIDARLSFPPQCDYLQDSGAGTYRGASYDAPVQPQPEPDGSTSTKIKDGVVVSITGYSMGQGACNPSGTSPLWIQFEREPGGIDSTVPVINMGGGPTLEQLQENNIPPVPSPYEGTVLESC